MNHLTDITVCNEQELVAVLDLAQSMIDRPDSFDHAQSGRLLINLFYEPSTRTRVSFEAAAIRLGMDVINVTAAGSSVEKGENLEDTFFTIQAMSPDCVVVRHPQEGAASTLADIAEPGTHVINAGDGIAAHPTQALLDALTLRQALGNFSDIRLAMVGDIRHSRVARSAILLLTRLGVGEIRLCGPQDFIPALDSFGESAPLSVFKELEEAVAGCNAIMMLRIQHERITSLPIPDADEYHRRWGLQRKHLDLAAPDCRILHPGPMNRGVEISSAVADGPNSLVRAQVRNGLFVRMGVLHHLLSS